ncbi:MAG: hypothetical protein JNL73_21045 [Anaerolineales bacterium]|nr:hypothetical protein [Anaerolineales bacterium]
MQDFAALGRREHLTDKRHGLLDRLDRRIVEALNDGIAAEYEHVGGVAGAQPA